LICLNDDLTALVHGEDNREQPGRPVMPKVILVPVSGNPTDTPVLATALLAARTFDGHLQVLHVRPDVRHDIAALASADMGMAAGLDATMDRMEQDAATHEQAAERSARAFFSQANVPLAESPGPVGPTYEWMAETGSEADWVAEIGRTADMIVVGRAEQGGMIALDLMEAALMDTGKAVLIATETPPTQLSGTVAIAWKDTPEAAGAVRAALPFIRNAAKVLIFTVEEDPETADRSHVRLARSLRWHNPNVGIEVVRRGGKPPVEALLAAVAHAGCSVLVMGGYGHTRLREAVFGGFTRAVLENAPIPVLMAH
jgi:nucleotide-binding universal stress UspA family protein